MLQRFSSVAMLIFIIMIIMLFSDPTRKYNLGEQTYLDYGVDILLSYSLVLNLAKLHEQNALIYQYEP